MTDTAPNASANSPAQQDIPQLRPIDRQFQRFLVDCYGADELTALAGGIASALLKFGHSCLFLDDHSGEWWSDGDGAAFQLPPTEEWLAALQAADAVGRPGERKPLILDDRRLYIFKYFSFESKVAERLRAMALSARPSIPESVATLAKELFNEKIDLSTNGGQLQAAGAFLPFFSRLSIITGGPGTGKTTVLAKLLALLCADSMDRGESFPIIRLAAPTGKAAQRLATSIQRFLKPDLQESNVTRPNLDERIVSHFSKLVPSTLHRLLGLYGNSPCPKFNRESPIEAEVVVVDEASMMDITLFARLIDALPPNARLILLGDRFQLASVDAGCVMADICDAFTPNVFSEEFASTVNSAIALSKNHVTASSNGDLVSPVVELKHSYRFEGNKPIGVVSKAVNSGSAEWAVAMLSADDQGEDYCTLTGHPGDEAMLKLVLEGFQPLLKCTQAEEAIKHLGTFMVLTALNEGRFGRVGINQQVYRHFKSIPPVRPIKITENSIQHRLFNGDMGVVMRTRSADGTEVERAWFPNVSDGSPTMSAADKVKRRAFLVGAASGIRGCLCHYNSQ